MKKGVIYFAVEETDEDTEFDVSFVNRHLLRLAAPQIKTEFRGVRLK